jgi:hypothetical protein
VEFDPKFWSKISPSAIALISQLLTYNVKNRITAKAAL